MPNSMWGVCKAILYREFAWFKRFLPDYIISWIFPFIFALSVIFLPASISGLNNVLERMSSLFGTSLNLNTALVLAISITGIINMVSIVVNDILQTFSAEFMYMEAGDIILEATDLKTYILVNAVTRPVLLTALSTLYLIPALTILKGFEGFILFLVVEAALIISAVLLGLYTSIFSIPVVFYFKVTRSWIVGNILAPLILAGSGVYMPLSIVPWILRYIAHTTIIPETSRLLYSMFLNLSTEVSWFISVSVILFTLYCILTSSMSKIADVKVKKK